MKFLLPLLALGGVVAYIGSEGQAIHTVVLLGAVGFYIIVNTALMQD